MGRLPKPLGGELKRFTIAALAIALVLPGSAADAAPKKCTSSQLSSISSQQSVVTRSQSTVSQDQTSYNKAQMVLNTANSKVSELSVKIAKSQKKIADLLSQVAKNQLKSPSIARGYQSQADSEARSLNGTQMSYNSAVSDAARLAKTANSELAKLTSSQKSLNMQNVKLATLKSQCTL